MVYVLSDFERDLQDSVRRITTKISPLDHQHPEAQRRDELWQSLVVEQGWAAIPLSEADGGAGGSFTDLCLVQLELGRTLIGVPIAQTAISAMAIAATAPRRRDLIDGLVDGSLRGTLLLDPAVTAHRVEAGWELSGRVKGVVGGAEASVRLVLARTDGEPLLIALDADSTGIHVRSLNVADHTRTVADLTFGGTQVADNAVLASGPAAIRAWELAQARYAVAVAADSVGVASVCLELACNYAQQRRQFGRLIGGFQAVKHRLADALIAVEYGRVAVRRAASSDDQLLAHAVIAKRHGCAAGIRVAETCFQIHGGISFTTELPVHLYYRRAQLNSLLVWSPERCVSLIAAMTEELSS